MAGLIPVIHRHKRRQPIGPQSINWALPLAQSLEFAIIEPTTTKPDFAYGRTVNTATGGWSRNATEYGEGLYSNAELNRSVSYNIPLLDKPFTLIIGYHIHTLPTASRTLCGNYITNTSGFRITPDTANFRAQFGRAGGAQTLYGSAIAVGSKIDAVIADDTDFYYYENGELSVSDTQIGFAAPTELFKIGGLNTSISTVAFCYMFSRALSADEVRQLYEEPYKLYVPSNRLLKVTSVNNFSLAGDIVGPPAQMSGELSHYTQPVEHGISADLVGGLTAQLSGTLERSDPPPPPDPVIIYTYGGDGRPITKRKRRPSANEELDLLFKDIINEFFGLNDVEALEDVIDSLPITFDIDLEAMTRIEEIKYLIAAYEQYLDDEAAAKILLMD